MKFRVYSTVDWEGHPLDVQKEVPYIHRWHPTYRKAMLAKFSQLTDWHKAHPAPVTLLTLTTHHHIDKRGRKARSEAARAMSIEKSWEQLARGRRLLTVYLRKYCPTLEYVWIVEPHQTGYPHIHAALIGPPPTEEQQERIRNLWANKYGYGSKEHGVDFTLGETHDIRNLKNYLMKYLAKTLPYGKTGSRYEDTAPNWTPAELEFNALAKEKHWRLWGASLALSRVMARPEKPEDDIYREWEKTSLIDEHGDEHVVQQRASQGADTHDSPADTRHHQGGNLPDHRERLPRRLPAPPAVQSLLSDPSPDAGRDAQAV